MKTKRIADRLFYGIIGLLVLVIGTLGSLVVYQQLKNEAKRMARGIWLTSNYLEKSLPESVARLHAKGIREVIENTAGETLQAVEIFDADRERIYVYERTGGNQIQYDRVQERDLLKEGRSVGKFKAYFSFEEAMKILRLIEFLRLIVLMTAACLVLGTGLYYLVRRMVLGPIESALAFSREVAAGNYDERIPVASQDEMGLLQDSLNRMADALQESVANLKASFSEAEGERKKALEASRLKSEFLANLSHEIRTPMNAVIGFSDLLLGGESSKERRHYLETIKNSAASLLNTINEILDFSKIEAGKLRLAEDRFLLKDLFGEIRPIVEIRLKNKEVSFQIDMADEVQGIVSGDKERLKQVLLNLLINATKFTKRGKIELKAGWFGENDQVLFQISDTGIGIKEEWREEIFEPFAQGDGTFTREHGGTGLGLAIAKRLIMLMGGEIWLESKEGKGSTFYFTALKL